MKTVKLFEINVPVNVEKSAMVAILYFSTY